jgi:hypothetical protein
MHQWRETESCIAAGTDPMNVSFGPPDFPTLTNGFEAITSDVHKVCHSG